MNGSSFFVDKTDNLMEEARRKVWSMFVARLTFMPTVSV